MKRSWAPALFVICTALSAHFVFWAWKHAEVFERPYTLEKWVNAFWEFFPAMLFMGAGDLAINWHYGGKGRG